MRKELLEGLTKDQVVKVKACDNPADLLQLAKDEGVELNKEQLEAVSGGCDNGTRFATCPKCGSNQIKSEYRGHGPYMRTVFVCQSCRHEWDVNP